MPLPLTHSHKRIRIVNHMDPMNNWDVSPGDIVHNDIGDLDGVEAIIDQEDVASSVFGEHRAATA